MGLGQVARMHTGATRTLPASGGKAPVIVLRKVLLPAPFGPSRAARSPRFKSISSLRKSSVSSSPIG